MCLEGRGEVHIWGLWFKGCALVQLLGRLTGNPNQCDSLKISLLRFCTAGALLVLRLLVEAT